VIIDMAPHDREGYRAEMGHVWLGFGEAQLAGWLHGTGFGPVRYTLLPADPAARGPVLFVAAAARPAAEADDSQPNDARAAAPAGAPSTPTLTLVS
jgi:ArsR family transcriptional regulator